MTAPISVLLIEDNTVDALLVKEKLRSTPSPTMIQLEWVDCLTKGLECLAMGYFEAVLLDLNLPDSAGLDTLQTVLSHVPDVPVVVMTGETDDETSVKAVQAGAQDYLIKGQVDRRLLTRVIHYAIERKRIEAQLKHFATHDFLTGLPNRALFYDRLSLATKRTNRRNTSGLNWKAAVMIMDLDNFKQINDSLGHESGDKVLRELAPRMRACLRQNDTVARMGGDEFAFVLEGIQDQADAMFVAQKIMNSLNEPPIPDAGPVPLGGSLGISLFPSDAEEIDLLIKYADQAMYAAKRQQLSICFYRNKNQS